MGKNFLTTFRHEVGPNVGSPVSFELARVGMAPVDSYEVKYIYPYFSPSGEYNGEWNNPPSGCFSDTNPIQRFWVLSDGKTEFSIENPNNDQGRFFSRWQPRHLVIQSPSDKALRDFKGVLHCRVIDSQEWVMSCSFICSNSIYRRHITLYLDCSIHESEIAQQIEQILKSKGYQSFDDVFKGS